jgi:muconolactone delta-isomerase
LSDQIGYIVRVLQKVFRFGIEAADSRQKLRYLINEFCRVTWARSDIDNLGKEMSDIIEALQLRD